jgi:Lipoprotein confined to pathogenic Mycobacterium
MSKRIGSQDRRSLILFDTNTVSHRVLDAIGMGAGVRRCWPVSVAMIAAVMLSACHYNPYRWPRPGEPAAKTLENQLNERDSLQDAANDMIAVGAAMRDAAQRVYPDTEWKPTSADAKANCGPPYVFLSGAVYVLARWQSPAPTEPNVAQAVISAAADVLKAHHAEKIDSQPGRSVSGVLPREHGELQFIISMPVSRQQAPTMAVSGTTGCHHAKPGPGPWDNPVRPVPAPGNAPAPAPPPGSVPALAPPP